MKKNLFYAAFALAMMASCTNEDNLVVDPVEPTPEDKVALNLGVVAPSVNATVGARGTGSVGDVAGTNNKWNSQQLYIAMIDRETGDLAKDVEKNDTIMGWNTYTYRAPKSTASTDSVIRIYQKGTYNDSGNNKDMGTIQYLYYPTQGTFDFYGWHLDDATIAAGTTANPSIIATAESGSTASTTSIKITGITIDGTQDIMGAKTKAANADTYGNKWNTNLEGWAFSARTARNDIDPILKFEHQLARVKFFVKAGSQSAAIYDNGSIIAKAGLDDASAATTSAMYVTGIAVAKVHPKFDMTLNNTEISTTVDTSVALDTFKLGTLIDGKVGGIEGDSLTPVAPNYHKDYTGNKAQGVTTNEAQVGESIMFLPVSATDGKGTDKQIEILLNLKQRVQLTDDETNAKADSFGIKTQSSKVTVLAGHVKTDTGYATAFEAGKSYNVYITIYGFERIEISAELTPWEMGGDVDVDIEDGISNNGTGNSGTETPANVTSTFVINDGTITDANISWSYNEGQNTGTGYTVEAPEGTVVSYTITKNEYETKTGTFTVSASTTDIAITLVQTQQAPKTKQLAVNIQWPENTTGVENVLPVVKKQGEDTAVDPTEGKYSLEIGQTYTITVTHQGYTQKDYQTLEVTSETTDITVNMETETSAEP